MRDDRYLILNLYFICLYHRWKVSPLRHIPINNLYLLTYLPFYTRPHFFHKESVSRPRDQTIRKFYSGNQTRVSFFLYPSKRSTLPSAVWVTVINQGCTRTLIHDHTFRLEDYFPETSLQRVLESWICCNNNHNRKTILDLLLRDHYFLLYPDYKFVKNWVS